MFYFPDLPTLLVDCTSYLRELAVDEPELDEVGAENCDGGDRPLVHLVNVHQMQRLQPVTDHLQSVVPNYGLAQQDSSRKWGLFHTS